MMEIKGKRDCWMFKVLMLEPIRPIGFKMLEDAGVEVVVAPNRDEKTAAEMIDGFDGIITRTTYVGKEIIDNGNKLKVIGRHGAGLDIVDVKYAEQKGIQIAYTPAANARSVAEYVMTLMLAMTRHLIPGDKAQRIDKDFTKRGEFMGHDLEGKTLGIIGLGRIGRYIAKMASQGFDMKIIGYDPYVTQADLMKLNIEKSDSIDEILKNSDIVTLNCPLTEQVKGIINYERLKMMKKNAFLINCARGPIIVENDLAKALNNKVIAGAAIDVFSEEPPRKDNPLFDAPNLIATPHIATMSHESMDRMSSTLISEFLRIFGL
jgi:D-3-phosphoglycerate dehydrogenase